jgi:predicted metal-dependent phosphoesterase TrpH
MRIDLHTHSRISDGTDAPDELVRRARDLGLAGLALTDHDTFAGVPTAVAAGEREGVSVLPGVELSCEAAGVTIHLLGLGARPDTPLAERMARIRTARDARLDRVLAQLGDAGVVLTRAQVEAAAGPAVTLGRPHVADAMVAAGYVPDRDTAFARWLAEGRPGYVAHERIPLREGIALVQDAGGVAVIAHAWLPTSRPVLTLDFLAGLAQGDPGQARLDGLEVNHQDHDASVREQLGGLAARLGLIVTGGSDYHGTGKVDHDLGCNTTDMENWERIDALIRSRGGVVARSVG